VVKVSVSKVRVRSECKPNLTSPRIVHAGDMSV
jgi:hypothetical protein